VYSKLRIVWKTVKEANLTLSMQAWVYLIFMLYVLWYNITLITCLFLSLRSTIHVHLESSTPVTLPSLKMLLIHTNHMEVPSVNSLLCGCPNIETLKLRFATQSLDKVCVPPSLKRLKFTIDNEVGAYLEMNTPDLEYLYINRVTYGEVFSMYNLHNVVEAHLDVFPQSFGSVLPLNNLLGNLSGTKHLVLGRSTTKVEVLFYLFYICIKCYFTYIESKFKLITNYWLTSICNYNSNNHSL